MEAGEYYNRRNLQDRPNGNSCPRPTLNGGIACPDMQSPLSYMLAGLAAMVLLVAISVIILTCSYLRTRYNARQTVPPQHSNSIPASDLQEITVSTKPLEMKLPTKGSDVVFRDVVVIMAGEEKPTYLAQPSFLTHETKM